MGLPANLLKLITAVLFLLVLVFSGRKGEEIIHGGGGGQAVALLQPQPGGALESGLTLSAGCYNRQNGQQIRNFGYVQGNAPERAGRNGDGVTEDGHLRAKGVQNLQHGLVALGRVHVQPGQRDGTA